MFIHLAHEILAVSSRASHDEAKRAAETLCHGYQAERKVRIRIARIGSTYGPGMRGCDGSMISSFIAALMDGVGVSISEPNDATRTILYVEDCVTGLVKLMNSGYAQPLNIAGDEVLLVKDLLLHLRTLVANPSNAIPWKAVEFFPHSGSRRPTNSAAFVSLGWSPEVKAKDGLRATVTWFKEERIRKLAAKAQQDDMRKLAKEREDNLGPKNAKNLWGYRVEPYVPVLPHTDSPVSDTDDRPWYNSKPPVKRA